MIDTVGSLGLSSWEIVCSLFWQDVGVSDNACCWLSKDLEINEDRQNEWPWLPGKKITGHFALTQYELQPWSQTQDCMV